MISLYEKYLKLRKVKGVTDYRVAVETGITKSTFTDWKSGRSEPKLDKLKKISEYFGVSVDYFVEQMDRMAGDKEVAVVRK